MHKTTLICAVLLAASTLFSSSLSASTSAGKVVYAFGDVRAVSADGRARALTRGDTFAPGETVATLKGRAQIRFTDGGFAALQPNTEYKIEDYHYEGKADGNERSFLNLVRGSVRLVTGFIGRANKKNFRLRTAVATIGIRGTAGKVSHCDANCGERGPGTALAGYGGEWDLNSGSYSGPVKPGQATFCNGSSCFDIPGFGQRNDVEEDTSELDETLDESDESVADGDAEPTFQEGVQTDPEGRQCALGGACGGIIVATGLVSATANASGTQSFDNVVVVTDGGVPVAGVSINSSNGGSFGDGEGISLTAINADVLRQAIVDIPDPEQSAIGLKILDAVPASQLTALSANPATIGLGDFGRTTDNRLVYGRWQDGLVLQVFSDLAGSNVFSYLDLFEGNRSQHFIFGPDPGPMPTSGLARYAFTGGTFSTEVDGNGIGRGITSGNLAVNFLTGTGALQMSGRHAGNPFQISASLLISDRFFTEDLGIALFGANTFPAYIDGFFAAQGARGPQAAGLSYLIDGPRHIIGTAGFGLSQATASTAPVVPVAANGPAAAGSYVAFAHNFIDIFAEPNSNAFDFEVGGSDTAQLTNGVVSSFSSVTHPGLCTPACTFNANAAGVTKDATGPGATTENAALGISWARFSPGYNVSHADVSSPLGSAHVLHVDVPTALANIPLNGSGKVGTYSMLVGGSRPTVLFTTGGTLQSEVVSTITGAAMSINFDDGSLTAAFTGTFPDGGGVGTWSLGGTGSPGSFVRTDGIHSLSLSGAVTSLNVSDPGASTSDCSGGCSLFGHTHFDLAGVNATAVAGSVQGNTSGGGFEPTFLMSGTYVLEGSIITP